MASVHPVARAAVSAGPIWLGLAPTATLFAIVLASIAGWHVR